MNMGQVSLALHDLLPVIVAGLGLWKVTEAVGRRRPPARTTTGVGAALIVAAGASKAGAKLLSAMGIGHAAWLDAALFPLLAPGMVLAAAGVWAAVMDGALYRRVASFVVAAPSIVWLGSTAIAATGGPATAVLIGVATVGNVALGVGLIRWSRREALGWAGWLFGLNIAIVIGLAGLARGVPQTVGWQWTEQNLNLLAQAAFLVAATALVKRESLEAVRA